MPDEGSSRLWQPNKLAWSADRADILPLLAEAKIEDCWLLTRGSNYTFLVKLSTATAGESLAIYKPRKGEAPLYDFPDGTLYRREYAAYLMSEALGWRLVPPTIIREGPHGVGSVQLFIEADQNDHYFVFRDRRKEEAKRVAVFDFITNNADRKAGHCLEDGSGRVWLIDNGLTFNSAPKLRTVVWDFQGERIPPQVLADLAQLREALSGSLLDELSALLSKPELSALQKRLEQMLRKPYFPLPGAYRSVPWPPI